MRCSHLSHIQQLPSLNAYADLSNGDKGLNFGMNLDLHPYILLANNEGSGEPVFCTGSPEPSLLNNAIRIE